ncbi:MAG: hypothetical protein II840_10725 [Kiritimatiellae bacterium]|nr:hypothetical protein [Kiritimatiellia bacterium]
MRKLICSALIIALVAHVAYAGDYEVAWRATDGTSIATPANWAHYLDNDLKKEPVATGFPDTLEVPAGDNLIPVIKDNGKAMLSTGEEYSGSWLLINEYWGDTTFTVDGGTLKLAKQLMIGRYEGWGAFEMKSGTATVGALQVAHWKTSHDAVARFTGGDFLAKGYDWTGAITVGLQHNNTRGKMIVQGGNVATEGNVTVANAQMWAGETGVDDGFPEESYWALSNTLDVVSGVLSITGKLNIAADNRSVGIVTLSGGRIDITDAVQMSYKSTNALSRLTIAGGEFNMTEDEIVMFSEDWQGSDVDRSHVTNSVAEIVLDGGVLKTKRIRRHPNTTSKARITFNGGTLQPIDNRTDFLDVTSFDRVTVAEGGIVIDTAGHDVTISGDFSGVGGLVKKGAGTLKVANGRKWSGSTTVLEGTLDLNNAGNPIDGTLVVSAAGTVVNAVVAPESVEFRGDGTLPLLSYGATYGDYTAGSIKIAGGSVKIPNSFNALLHDAVAHYDPSNVDSLTKDADGKVTKVANLAKLGSAMDAASYDTSDTGYISGDWKMNGLTALVFTNNYGYVSAGTVNFAENQGRTVVSVGYRSKELGALNPNNGWTDNIVELFPVAFHQGSDWNGDGKFAIQMEQAYDYVRCTAACTTNGIHAAGWDPPKVVLSQGLSHDIIDVIDFEGDGTGLYCHGLSKPKDGTGDWATAEASTLAGEFDSFALDGGTVHVNIGFRRANLGHSAGVLGETLAYSRRLENAELAAIRSYLQNKWVDANMATAAVGATGVATLVLAENAAVDFDGAPVVIENLVGGGAITGGTGYTITGSITIEVGEDGAIVPFAFDGPVTIGEGVVLNVVGAENLLKEKVVFLSVSNGAISGKIASVAADDGKAATASKSSGTSYCVNKGKLGLCVVLR